MNEHHPNIAVVDDDADTVDMLRDYFELQGVLVQPCPMGEPAVACIVGAQPDVVILDIQLDGLNGVELLHLLRAEPATLTVPIVFFSSSERLEQLLPNYADYGAYFVGKPKVLRLGRLIMQLVQDAAA